MLRKGIVITALCLLPAVAQAQARGPWEVTLGGSGVNGSRFNGFSGTSTAASGISSATTSKSVFVSRWTTPMSASVRAWNGSTPPVAVDLHFPLGDMGQFQPFVGVNLGYVYGDAVNDTWEAPLKGASSGS